MTERDPFASKGLAAPSTGSTTAHVAAGSTTARASSRSSGLGDSAGVGAAIHAQTLVKRYGATAALDGLELIVPRGSCFGLIGPNGAGKTTLFALTAGYLRPTSGAVRVFDRDPARPGALKGTLGILPQDAVLPRGPVGESLTYWARLSGLQSPESEARAALSRVGMEKSWATPAEGLSHGMAKRVALAQALMGDPPLLLLDEPTAGLDPAAAATVRELIASLRGERTLLVSSHNLTELESLCDAAAILEKGKLAQAGWMAELTLAAAELRIKAVGGELPLPLLWGIEGVEGAEATDEPGVVRVRYRPDALAPEAAMSRCLETILAAGLQIVWARPGRSLEERVVEAARAAPDA